MPAVPVAVSSGCSGCGLMELGSVADTQREGEGVRSVTPCSVRCHSPREGDGPAV